MNQRDYIPKTEVEIRRDFAVNFGRLVRAGQAFDTGHQSEALSIAVLVYLFVHDHGRSAVSLLTLAGRKDSIRYRDTAKPLNPRNMFAEHPLAGMSATAHPEEPHFEYLAISQLNFMPFDQEIRFGAWWDGRVLRDRARREFSRKNLIFVFRNKMGGGHASSGYDRLDEMAAIAFADLGRHDASGWFISSATRVLRPEYGVQFATVRQIGWELEHTLRSHCSDLLGDDAASPQRPRMIPVNDAEHG